MKRYSIIAAIAAVLLGAAAITTNAFMNNKTIREDSEGHVLASLWKNYQAAQNADRPQKMSSVLEEIKKEASARRLHWDFYDAAVKKVEAESSRNWKLRDSLQVALRKEIEDYNEPVMTYCFRCGDEDLLDFIIVNKARLQAASNSQFYGETGLGGRMNGLLTSLLKDDYDFALWSEFFGSNTGDERIRKVLKESLGESYPQAAFLEYSLIPSSFYDPARKDKLSEFASKYDGKAVSLLAKGALLGTEKGELDVRNAGSDEYKTLFGKCKAFEKERKSYSSGIDLRIASSCSEAVDLMKSLENRDVLVSFKGDTAVVALRNLDKINVELVQDIKNGKSVFKKTVVNPKNSFYALDTVKVKLPKCDDGEYVFTAKNGKTVDEESFTPKTLSIALRSDSESKRFYVADYQTGEPVKEVDLELLRSGKSIAKVSGVVMDGFTPLPEEIASNLKQDAVSSIVASFKDEDGFIRKSSDISVGRESSDSSTEGKEGLFCNLFTDKSAYNPGETIKFKAVVYKGDIKESLRVLEEGSKIIAKLVNSEGKTVGTLDLLTNDFGSVAGEFDLPENEKNGRFTLNISNDKPLASKSIVVDEFILPSYDLSFDKVDRLFFSGDTVQVCGKVVSYSGHPLSAADVRYSVDGDGVKVADGSVQLSSDGSFSVIFPSKKDRYVYGVRVTVSDGTGETKEFYRRVFLMSNFLMDVSLVDKAAGEVRMRSDLWNDCSLLSDDKAVVSFKVLSNDGKVVPVPIEYEVKDAEGETLFKGSVQSGDEKEFTLKGSGLYSVTSKASAKNSSGKEIKASDKLIILKVGDSDKALSAKVENVFKLVGSCADGTVSDGEKISLQFGAGDGPVWAVVELFGDKRQVLDSKMVHLEGKAGEEGSLTTVAYDYASSWPDAVFLHVFYFRKGSHFSYAKVLRRKKSVLEMPLEFSTFQGKALPEKECSLRLKSLPGVEAVAAVFDAGSETIAPSRWSVARLQDITAQRVYVYAEDGSVSSEPDFYVRGLGSVNAFGSRRMKTMSRSVMSMESISENAVMAAPSLVDDSAVSDEQTAGSADEATDVAVRSDFSSSLAFEPFLRSDAEGNIGFSFKTSGKLSTFVVQVYAHDKRMRNAVVRREMVVSVPVKVAVAEPKYLYKGDKYVLHATVSSASDKEVSGLAGLEAYSSANYKDSKPFASLSKRVTVPAGGSVPVEFEVDPKGCDTLGLKVVFTDQGKTFSDGVFVSVPVRAAEQTITEAHSAVLLAGMDKNALARRLEKEFTGTTSRGAECKEVDIRQMLIDAVPEKVEPSGKDVLALSEAFYIRRVAASLGAETSGGGYDSSSAEVSSIADAGKGSDSMPSYVMPDDELSGKILACKNADGGFGWFEGMSSSPVVTAVILERFAKLRDAGLLGGSAFDPSASVAYLDRSQFIHGSDFPFWCGRLSLAQYAYVRSLFCSVPFDVSRETKSEKSEFKENLKAFKEYVSGYLAPSSKDGRGLNGQILAKARRIKTLLNLVNNDGGLGLASAWGLKFSAASKMNKSLASDSGSLLEYAVSHRDGGWYYPNAVMPWRGLLESELYAHSMLCDLLSDPRVSGAAVSSNSASAASSSRPVPSVSASPGSSSASVPSAAAAADGIRIWMMLQKETQKWDSDPAFVDALNSVMAGSEDLLSTRVISLTKTYRKPFAEIVAAGNGFTIERRFYKEVTGADKKIGSLEVRPGDLLHVGDKLTVEYRIWNQENRSFVKLTAPREAAFRPVNQLSGCYGWWLSPLSVSGVYSVTPQGYRNVKADRTEYYFDVYPEEKTTVAEEFFVTQEGAFSAPVVTVESLYAPHYRANDSFRGAVKSASL